MHWNSSAAARYYCAQLVFPGAYIETHPPALPERLIEPQTLDERIAELEAALAIGLLALAACTSTNSACHCPLAPPAS
jgi:hypothetical protein